MPTARVDGEGVSGWRRHSAATRFGAPRPPQGRPVPGSAQLPPGPCGDAARPPRLVGTRHRPAAPASLPGLWEERREGREPAPSARPETSSRAAGAVGKGARGVELGTGKASEREKERKDTLGKISASGGSVPLQFKMRALMNAGFQQSDGRIHSEDLRKMKIKEPQEKEWDRGRLSPNI